MKAILTVEIPERFDPRYCQIGGDGNIYYKRDGERASIIGNMSNLKPLPQKIESGKIEDGTKTNIPIPVEHFAMGYNKCLDDFGETEYNHKNTKQCTANHKNDAITGETE